MAYYIYKPREKKINQQQQNWYTAPPASEQKSSRKNNEGNKKTEAKWSKRLACGKKKVCNSICWWIELIWFERHGIKKNANGFLRFGNNNNKKASPNFLVNLMQFYASINVKLCEANIIDPKRIHCGNAKLFKKRSTNECEWPPIAPTDTSFNNKSFKKRLLNDRQFSFFAIRVLLYLLFGCWLNFFWDCKRKWEKKTSAPTT